MFPLFPLSSRQKTEETDERALLEASTQSHDTMSMRGGEEDRAAAVELADLATARVVASASGPAPTAAMNEPSAQREDEEKKKKKPRTLSHLIYSLVHLALWAQIGT